MPYANHFQLRRLARRFATAGIMVIWRPFIRPMNSMNRGLKMFTCVPGAFRLTCNFIMNRPWRKNGTIPTNPQIRPSIGALLGQYSVSAIDEVYAAGGYIGLQSIDLAELRATLQGLRAAGLAEKVDRLFFVPHPYGLNHPQPMPKMKRGVGFSVLCPSFCRGDWLCAADDCRGRGLASR